MHGGVEGLSAKPKPSQWHQVVAVLEEEELLLRELCPIAPAQGLNKLTQKGEQALAGTQVRRNHALM